MSRFQPYGGAGPVPTSCCEFAVVDTQTGKEVCRVWDDDMARKIALLLNVDAENFKDDEFMVINGHDLETGKDGFYRSKQ